MSRKKTNTRLRKPLPYMVLSGALLCSDGTRYIEKVISEKFATHYLYGSPYFYKDDQGNTCLAQVMLERTQ